MNLKATMIDLFDDKGICMMATLVFIYMFVTMDSPYILFFVAPIISEIMIKAFGGNHTQRMLIDLGTINSIINIGKSLNLLGSSPKYKRRPNGLPATALSKIIKNISKFMK